MAIQLLKGRSRIPCLRDQDIYLRITGKVCSQGAAAREHGVSQPRIFAIVKRVDDWIGKYTRKRSRRSYTPQEQLNMAKGFYHYLVDKLWRETMAKFHESQQDVVKYREWEKAGKRFTVMTRRPGRGKIAYLRLAWRCCEELARIEGLEVPTRGRRKPPVGAVRQLATQAVECVDSSPLLDISDGGLKPTSEPKAPQAATHRLRSAPVPGAKRCLTVTKRLRKSPHNKGVAATSVASANFRKSAGRRTCDLTPVAKEPPKTFLSSSYDELVTVYDPDGVGSITTCPGVNPVQGNCVAERRTMVGQPFKAGSADDESCARRVATNENRPPTVATRRGTMLNGLRSWVETHGYRQSSLRDGEPASLAVAA